MASYTRIVDLNMFKVFRMNSPHAQYNLGCNENTYPTNHFRFWGNKKSNEENNKKICNMIRSAKMKY